MDYDLISKLSLEEELSQNSWLEGQQEKRQASGKKEFVASENCVKPIKTAVEVKADLKTEHLTKLKIDNKNIPDPFKTLHVWMNEHEGMKFWPMLLHPDIFNYLLFLPLELGCNDQNGHKNSKAYSYHKSGWLTT